MPTGTTDSAMLEEQVAAIVQRLMGQYEIRQNSELNRNQFIGKAGPVQRIWPVGDNSFPANFQCSQSGATVTVAAGNIILHDIGSYPVAEDDVLLSGETDWVFVWHNKDHSASGIDHQASVMPNTDGNMWRWPLAKYELSGTSYKQVELCHEYDIHLGNPLR